VNDFNRNPASLRYERKFAVNGSDFEGLVVLVKSSRFLFSKEYPDRVINNIYYDTPELRLYYDSIEGASRRKKFRLRWYGTADADCISPVLEIKNKIAALGWKDSFAIPEVKNQFMHRLDISDCDLPESVLGSLKIMRPVLNNRYKRSYYRSADRKFRLTIDQDISFSPISLAESPMHLERVQDYFVIELKYAQGDIGLASAVAMALPFRKSRNSKYTVGIDLISRGVIERI
jgi:SPX domain protein involved in polyphosphate accumulation